MIILMNMHNLFVFLVLNRYNVILFKYFNNFKRVFNIFVELYINTEERNTFTE